MRKKILLMLLLCLSTLVLRAQKSFELYYVAHEHYESSLMGILNEVRQNARYNTNKVVVFYLANTDHPEWFVVSPNDDKSYQKFMAELGGQTSHNVYPEVDRLKLIEILSSKDLNGGRDLSAFGELAFNFYINPTFAMMDYCDALIGRMYWDLDLASIPRERLEINIYYHSDDGYTYDENQLFGRKNLMNGFPVLFDTF